MPSPETERVRQTWSKLLAVLAPPAGIPEYRAGYEELCAGFPIPEDTAIKSVDAGGTPALLVAAASADSDKTVVWAHSGGYVFGSANCYRAFAAALSAASGARVLLVDYRLAPEHVYPAAHEDVKGAYQSLIKRGADPKSIVLGGDSAGGGIIAGALLSLKDDGEVLPAGVMVVSPFADFTFTGESMTARAGIDPIGSRAMLEAMGGLYRKDEPIENPYLSAVYGDWSGAPPLLALVGTEEVLYDDAVRLVQRAKSAGVNAKLEIGEGQFHIWPLFNHYLPEGRLAIEQLGRFVRVTT